jgi:hypothetical protein
VALRSSAHAAADVAQRCNPAICTFHVKLSTRSVCSPLVPFRCDTNVSWLRSGGHEQRRHDHVADVRFSHARETAQACRTHCYSGVTLSGQNGPE